MKTINSLHIFNRKCNNPYFEFDRPAVVLSIYAEPYTGIHIYPF